MSMRVFMGVGVCVLALVGMALRNGHGYTKEVGLPTLAVAGARPAFEEVLGRFMPSVAGHTVRGEAVALEELVDDGFVALWLFRVEDCLACLAEVSSWNALVWRGSGRVTPIAIAIGPTTEAFQTFVAAEIAFDAFRTDDATILTELGLPAATPISLLLNDGRVVLARDRKQEGLSFTEQVSLLRD